MLPAMQVLAKLEKPRQVGPGRWVARCPAHPDRQPSLSVKEAPDGRVLVYCFAGCPTQAVLAALGLEWCDLFPDGDWRPRPRTNEARQEAARRQAEAILERRWQELVNDTALRLAGLIQRAGALLERGGWRLAIEGEGPAAELAAELAHQLSYCEWLFDQINRREPLPEAVKAAKEVIRKWA